MNNTQTQELSAETLVENFTKLLGVIQTHIASPRKEQLLKLYTDHQVRITTMPASQVVYYHNAFAGGYVDHVLRVVSCALTLSEQWLNNGLVDTYTEEELVFAALNHDLGKIGTEEAECYIPNLSDWHVKNQGKVYTHNEVNPFMTVPDRGLFLLQQRNIPVSLNEYLGIKLHDGLYDQSNAPYYISRTQESKLRSALPIILHHADHMASCIEYSKWLSLQTTVKVASKKAKNAVKSNPMNDSELTNMFANF